jgi:propanediol dehydratase small subunit
MPVCSMSLRNIILLLFFAVCFLAGGLAPSRRFSTHPLLLPFAIVLLGGFIVSITEGKQRRAFLQRFWNRACMGTRWRRRFPTSSARQIREFLGIFVDAFAFPPKRRLSFSPDDRVVEIYRGLYPDKDMADCLELETLALLLRKRYGINAASFWRSDITLGELFAYSGAT